MACPALDDKLKFEALEVTGDVKAAYVGRLYVKVFSD